MMNKGIVIETWRENRLDVLHLLKEFDCLDIRIMSQDSQTILASARTSLIGMFRLFLYLMKHPEMKMYV